MITFKSNASFQKDATVLLLSEAQVSRKKIPAKSAEEKKRSLNAVKTVKFSAKPGETLPVLDSSKVILLVGVGKEADLTPTSLRVLIRKALASSYLAKAKNIEVVPHEPTDFCVHAVIDAISIGTYVWKKYKNDSSKGRRPAKKKFFIVAPRKKDFEQRVLISGGVNFARDLVNDNADVTNAKYLAGIVKGLVKGKKGVRLEILGPKELKKKGLNLHLAVNQGSRHEPRLVIVKYTGAPKRSDLVALVGKGITYDTGGLNLKPSGYMETMKCDMGGAAAVIGVLKNVLSLKLKKNILFVCGLAENAIGSGSYKPGDVFKSYDGKTVEIANTDAEGRLVLADAIAYVTKNYKPKKIVDIATLTGACVVALGNEYSGLVTTDDKFSRSLVRASNETDDRVWRLPSYPGLKDSVKSLVADIKNLGYPKGAAGTLTAAEFLRQFTGKTTWAHLDIAGTAFVDGPGRTYFGHGATGAGVRLLTNYLINN